MKHIVGWTHPPHAFEVIPSFDPKSSRGEQIRAVLIDYEHDDDLAKAGAAVLSEIGGPRPQAINPNGTVSAWLPFLNTGIVLADAFADPANFGKVFGVVRPTGSLPTNVPGQQLTTFAYMTGDMLNAIFLKHDLSGAIRKAMQKRAALGPLPPNDYTSDPIVIYYYDNDHIKRILYPRSAISTASGMALDPQNLYWWKGNAITTQQLNGDGTWGDEGFDWNKDVIGNISEIVGTILAILSVILSATGLGAAAGSAFAAAAAAVLSQVYLATVAIGTIASEIDTQLSGGTLYDVLNVWVKGVGAILGGAGEKALSDTTKLLVSTLESVMPLTQNTDSLSYPELLLKIENGLTANVVISDAYADDMSNFFGSALGSVFGGGYQAALTAPPPVIDGILGILTDPSQKKVFQIGALLGHLKGHPLSIVYHGFAPPPLTMISPIATKKSAKADLISYVKTVLNPRYNFQS